MPGLPVLTMEGRLTADPELRFTPAGVAVANFTLAAQDRRKTDGGDWEDAGDPLFVRINVWRQAAENVAESLVKGDLVLVTGKLNNRKWEDRDGNARYSLELTAYTVAASLQFRAFKHQTKGRSSTPDSDPWASDTPPADDDTPPF